MKPFTSNEAVDKVRDANVKFVKDNIDEHMDRIFKLIENACSKRETHVNKFLSDNDGDCFLEPVLCDAIIDKLNELGYSVNNDCQYSHLTVRWA